MSNTTISQILDWPNGSVVDSITGKITEVYEHREVSTKFGSKTIQNAFLEDSAGKKIKLAVWEHPEISVYKGKNVVLQSNRNRKGDLSGLEVKHDEYQGKKSVNLNVNKSATFQIIEIQNAYSGDSKAPSGPSEAQSVPSHAQAVKTPINGQKVGNAISNAVQFMTASGEPFDQNQLKEIADKIIRVSIELESTDYSPVEQVAGKNPF